MQPAIGGKDRKNMMVDRVAFKSFQPHRRHMAFSIAHYPSMKLLLHLCMETKRLGDNPRT